MCQAPRIPALSSKGTREASPFLASSSGTSMVKPHKFQRMVRARGQVSSAGLCSTATDPNPLGAKRTMFSSSTLAGRGMGRARARGGGRRKHKGGVFTVRARTVEDDQVLETILTAIRQANSMKQEPDFYDLLGLQVGAEPKEIKKAYRSRARICHPDLAGEDGHEACVVLNEAYATLMDDDLRENYEAEAVEFDFYDEGNPFAEAMKGYPYTGQPLSRMVPLDHEENMVEKEDLILQAQQINKAVFVDEITCIGCTMCTHCAPKVFEVEEESGRARAVGQWLNDEDEIQDAIDSCPVDCIHWVPKEQLAPLEYTTQVICTERVSVGMMLSGQGVHRMDDPFDVCKQFLQFMADREEKRRIIIKEQKMKKQRREEAERMRKENEEAWKNTGKSDFWKKAANPEGNKKA